MGNIEALALHRGIGVESHVEPVAGGDDWVWKTAATQSAELTGASAVPVEDFQTIVGALHVRFQFKVVERLHVESSQRTSKSQVKVTVLLNILAVLTVR